MKRDKDAILKAAAVLKNFHSIHILQLNSSGWSILTAFIIIHQHSSQLVNQRPRQAKPRKKKPWVYTPKEGPTSQESGILAMMQLSIVAKVCVVCNPEHTDVSWEVNRERRAIVRAWSTDMRWRRSDAWA